MFRELFLTRQQQKKIHFFQLMERYPAGEYSVQSLSQQLDCSYQSFLNMLQEINDTLLAIHEEPLFINSSTIYWESTPTRSNNFLITQVKHSLPYRFLLSSLFHPDKSLHSFCEEHRVKEMTVLKQMRPLTNYLEECNIRTNLAKMALIGHEAVIRMFYIKTLWSASFGDDLNTCAMDFTPEDNLVRDLMDVFHLPLHPKLVRLMLCVSRLRNTQQKHLTALPFDDLLFSQITPLLENYLSNQLKTAEAITHQVEFFNYLFYYYPYEAKNQHPSSNPLMFYYTKNVEERDPLCLAIDSFYRYCSCELLQGVLGEQEERMLLNNVARTFLSYSIQKKEIPLLFETGSKEKFVDSELYGELYPAIKAAVKKLSRRRQLAWLENVLDSLAKTLCLSLLPLFFVTDEKIRVGLVSIPNYLYLQHVIKYLQSLTFIEIVFQPQPNDQIDLFITTFKELLPKQNAAHYLLNILNTNYETDLLPLLLSIQNKKRFAS
ncbi:MAG: helix-turn-helix domain-containing protein [Enterococcus gilvus]